MSSPAITRAAPDRVALTGFSAAAGRQRLEPAGPVPFAAQAQRACGYPGDDLAGAVPPANHQRPPPPASRPERSPRQQHAADPEVAAVSDVDASVALWRRRDRFPR